MTFLSIVIWFISRFGFADIWKNDIFDLFHSTGLIKKISKRHKKNDVQAYRQCENSPDIEKSSFYFLHHN